jgi:hypothetical protein
MYTVSNHQISLSLHKRSIYKQRALVLTLEVYKSCLPLWPSRSKMYLLILVKFTSISISSKTQRLGAENAARSGFSNRYILHLFRFADCKPPSILSIHTRSSRRPSSYEFGHEEFRTTGLVSDRFNFLRGNSHL